MEIPTWKVMTAISAGLVVFAVYVSVFDVSLDPASAVATFVVAILFSGILYVTVRFGYRLGNRMGPDEE